MIDRLVTMLCLLFCTYFAYSSEYKVIFTNYMITNNVMIKQIEDIGKSSSFKYSSDDILLIEKYSSFRDEHFVVTSKGRLDVDTLRPIPYARKVDEKYEIAYSDRSEGLRCIFEVKDLEDFLFLTGRFQFYSLVERQVFEPFPQLQAGIPIIVMGGARTNLMIHLNESELGLYGLLRGADGVAKSLSIMLIRYEPIEKGEKGAVQESSNLD